MASSTIHNELVQQYPASSTASESVTWTLFPAPPRRAPSKSSKMPQRKALRAPPPSPRNLGSAYLKNQNAEKLAEVCRVAPAALRRGLSFSSEDSSPGLTEDHTDSDTSLDEERYQATMSELWDTYHDLSHATRFANQEFNQLSKGPSKPTRKQIAPLDRTWATDLATTLDIPLPSPASPAFALQLQNQRDIQQKQDLEQQQAQQQAARKLREAKSMNNLQRSPSRRRVPRRHPDVLSTIPPLPAMPHTAPLPYAFHNRQPTLPINSMHYTHPPLRSQPSTTTLSPTHAQTTHSTWPPPVPRSDSSSTVPTLRAFPPLLSPPASPAAQNQSFPLPPLTRPNRSATHTIHRPSTAPSPHSHSQSSSSFLPPKSIVVPPVPALERSVWEYDDDDDDGKAGNGKGHGKGEGSFSKLLHGHVRNLSAGTKKSTASGGASQAVPPSPAISEFVVGEKGEKKKRTASDVLKGVFGIKAKA